MERHDPLNDEFADIGERLQRERPVATEMELESVRRRVLSHAKRAVKPRPNGVLMRPRLAITAMLVFGAMLSGTGGALALSGSSDQGSAAGVVYPRTPDVLGEEEGTDTPTTTNAPEVLGEEASDPGQGVQPAEQAVQADGRELPFTGVAAIPLIVAGVGLMLGGVMLRRRTRPAS